jgi:hypothetical protein
MSYIAGAIIEGGKPYAVFPRSLRVIESSDSDEAIGVASEIGWTRETGTIWSLKIGGNALAGLFIMIDREFVQFEYVSELSKSRRRVPSQIACT